MAETAAGHLHTEKQPTVPSRPVGLIGRRSGWSQPLCEKKKKTGVQTWVPCLSLAYDVGGTPGQLPFSVCSWRHGRGLLPQVATGVQTPVLVTAVPRATSCSARRADGRAGAPHSASLGADLSWQPEASSRAAQGCPGLRLRRGMWPLLALCLGSRLFPAPTDLRLGVSGLGFYCVLGTWSNTVTVLCAGAPGSNTLSLQ